MHSVSNETLKNAFKPFDVVSDSDGNVGFIHQVNVNDSQPEPIRQITYSVKWLTGENNKVAWYTSDDLTKHCNLFVKIAELGASTHEKHVGLLMSLGV